MKQKSERKKRTLKSSPLFVGASTALITPFSDDGSIDYESLKKLIEFQIENGISALVVCGTTGEVSTLTENEQNELIKYTVRISASRVPVIAGAGGSCTEKVCVLAKNAKKAGADGILSITPYYNKGTERGIIRHFEEVAKAGELPLIVYNVPKRTGNALTPEMYRKLSLIPEIIGVKEAGGNMEQVMCTASTAGENFIIYSGNDADTLPILSLGGKGVISVASNICPKEVSKVCASFFDGETEIARRETLRLSGLYTVLFSEVNPAPVKYAASLLGLCRENYRLPLTECRSETKDKIRKVMANLL